ncbi:hypothetical protein CLFO_04280 [Clostridium formicaceticum]|uniref:Uncharacterized protein n=1 Tax=Clostridium formicaceticum TaxID=1497 RepID=A0AAC9WET5_9CLOT|nr:hypothetical protein CLFO_04280 [Clostridium formicaceticum]
MENWRRNYCIQSLKRRREYKEDSTNKEFLLEKTCHRDSIMISWIINKDSYPTLCSVERAAKLARKKIFFLCRLFYVFVPRL